MAQVNGQPNNGIRYMTVAEYRHWDKHECPHCQGKEFNLGPRGGIMRNIECTGCGMKLNVFDPKEFASTLPGLGQVLHEPVGYKQPRGPSMKTWMNGLFGLRRRAKLAILSKGKQQ